MDSKERRRIFRDLFKERLYENGFQYKSNEFIRVHPGKVKLAVSMSIMNPLTQFIHFGILPMCKPFETEDPLYRPRMDVFSEPRKPDKYIDSPKGLIPFHDYDKEMSESRSGIYGFDEQYDAFWDKIFDDFNAVQDIESAYRFARGLSAKDRMTKYLNRPNDYYVPESIYMCIYLEKWDEALQYLNRVIQGTCDFIAQTIQLRDKMESQKSQISKEEYLSQKQLLENRLLREEQEKDQLCDFRSLFINGEHIALKDIVERNIAVWNDYCREHWPKFYR